MTFFSELIDRMANNPFIYRVVLNLLAKVEFKRDLCLNVRGLKMYSDTPDRFLASLLWKTAILESYETRLLQQLVKPGMRVVDIGANIGYYALLLARLVGQTGKVIAFEPDQNNYRLLLKNAVRNGLTTITAVEKAVADYTGRARLFINKGHRGDHRLFDPEGQRPSIEIETTTLDDFLADSPVDIIKMDIQGAEWLALQGMQVTLASNPELVMLIEFSPYHLQESGADPAGLLDLIRFAGFDIKLIDEKQKKLYPVSRAALLSRCNGRHYENLLLVKRK